MRLVGIDYLSIGDEEAHRDLLRSGIVAVEGLDLRGVEPGAYQLICLPLRLEARTERRRVRFFSVMGTDKGADAPRRALSRRGG